MGAFPNLANPPQGTPSVSHLGNASHLNLKVGEIFDKAERFFEVRVAQLLEEKRLKAIENGTILNARKAKRDARTAAGREKLDALVRRLADLAIIQERVIRDHCPDQTLVRNALEQHTRRLWLIQNTQQISLQLQPPMPPILPLPPQNNIQQQLMLQHTHQHPHYHPHQNSHNTHAGHHPQHPHPLPGFGHPPPQIMPGSPYGNTSIVIRQQQILPAYSPSMPNSPPGPFPLPLSLPAFDQGAGVRALNPNADPWEAKPPSPRPSLPPPLPITPLGNLFDLDDDPNNEIEDDVTTPIFPATESVLQHLGPDFEDEMDEYSPCSILDIGSSPVKQKKNIKKILPFDY